MTLRLYLIPATGTGASREDARRAAYVRELGASYVAMDFGLEPVFLVAIDDAFHAALTAHADVTALPLALDTVIGAARASVEAALESYGIPGDWVGAAMTYRAVTRIVAAFCVFMQRYAALAGGRLFGGGVTLATRFNQLPANTRTLLQQTADELGIDRTGIVATMTLRQILKIMADGWAARPLILGSITI